MFSVAAVKLLRRQEGGSGKGKRVGGGCCEVSRSQEE